MEGRNVLCLIGSLPYEVYVSSFLSVFFSVGRKEYRLCLSGTFRWFPSCGTIQSNGYRDEAFILVPAIMDYVINIGFGNTW